MIPLPGWCRATHLATLGLSMLCLIVVEEIFLPTATPYLFLLSGLVAAAWFTEGRWRLPIWAANGLALSVTGLSALWLWRNLTMSGSLFQHVAFPAVLVPYAGIVLLFLMLLMLFRSRGAPDFWRLQGLGFVQVAVACALAGPPMFGLLVLLYLAAGLTCLSAHYRFVAGGSATPGEGLLAWPRFTLRWLLAVALPAIALTLVTPRGDGLMWDPYGQFGARSAPIASVGYDAEIDLGQTGEIELNEQLAFSVEAVDANNAPKDDLSLEQRWRGAVLDLYDDGKWRSYYRGPDTRFGGGQMSSHLPDLGPNQFFLTFRVQPQKAGGLFVADPVTVVGRTFLPLRSLHTGPRHITLFSYAAGTILPLPVDPRLEYLYQQVLAPAARPNRTPVRFVPPSYISRLKYHSLPDLEVWTQQLLTRLATEGRFGLTRDDLAILSRHANSAEPIPPRAGPIARALSDYLAYSREYTYTLDRRRQDNDADPAVDFLCNTKEGHCERFATGLALMLRTLGIPARLVKGFRGAEPQGDGRYFIRQRFAHAWVEVLVPHDDDESIYSYDWLTLDPTTSASAPELARVSTWHKLIDRVRNFDQLWRELIVDLRADQQIELWNALAPPLLSLVSLGLAAALLLLLVQKWRGRRMTTARNQSVPIYARLVRVLGRFGGPQPQPTQTPREFASAASAFLRPTLAGELAAVPDETVRLLYEQRFGGITPAPDEVLRLNACIDQLADRLERDAAERAVNPR